MSDRKILFQTDAFEIVSIDWTESRVTSAHDHGWSQCHVLIEDGVFENRLDLGAKIELQILEKGQVLTTPIGAKHELVCKSKTGKTLHVYTPKIEEFDDRGVFKAASLETLQHDIALSEPTRSDSLKSLLERLQAKSIDTRSPYFMNQLFSGVMPQMLMADELMAKGRTTLATFEASPVYSAIEIEVIQALGERIGWGKNQRGGVSVPGGSAANFMALHCARQKRVPDIKQFGMGSSRASSSASSSASGGFIGPFKVFVSSEAHYSFKKACVVLGLGLDALVAVPCDAKGQMRADELERLIVHSESAGETPLLVCSTAGTTVLGAFDPVAELAPICRKHNVWLHVDGAWGGPALFSKRLEKFTAGFEQADSVTFDAHKLFGASLTCSFFLTRHNEILLKANDVSGADYLFHADDASLDRGRLSWQCGRGADAVSFWAIWKSLGSKGLGEFVDRLLNIRDETVAWVKTQDRLELIAEPDYLNICVRVAPPLHAPSASRADWSKQVREQLKNNDQAMVNFSANVDGTFLRLILANPYLQFEHVRQLLTWALEV